MTMTRSLPKENTRVLIVEDSFIVAYHLQTTLESEGYMVLGKHDSGEEAIQSVKNNRPDLVLMDIMLSGKMDGIETASILKSKFNIPVIYITALTDKDTIGRAKITEPYGYLTKPFEDREIFTVIEMALYKHRIESRLRESEEKYFGTVNSISDAVITINKDFKISYLNPSASAIMEWPVEEAIDKPVTEVMNLFIKTSDSYVKPMAWESIDEVNRMPENLVLQTRSGRELPIGESSLSTLLDGSGKNVGLVLIFKDLTEKREREKLIQEMELQRKSALIEGQEKERARIAQDLHDGLGQMLNAIKMNAKIIFGNSTQATDLSRLLDEAIHESIRISENLLPSKLRDFDLNINLKSLCSQTSSTTLFNINFYENGTCPVLDQSKKVNLYRIAQEALNNAIKHSKARSITVQLSSVGETLRLSIEDDGKGIDNKIIERHHGLNNMRDRAEIIGGKLIVESDPLRGTLIVAEIDNDSFI